MDKDEIIAFHDYVCQVAGIRELPVIFKNVKSYGGKARLNKNKDEGDIVYAESMVVHENEKYQESLIIHEISHFMHWWEFQDKFFGGKCQHHDHDFKVIERKLLKQFGMFPAYNGRYASVLFNGEGEILWHT